MKKNPAKLVLNRETLRQLGEPDLRRLDRAAGAQDLSLKVVACYSYDIPSCVCTGTGP